MADTTDLEKIVDKNLALEKQSPDVSQQQSASPVDTDKLEQLVTKRMQQEKLPAAERFGAGAAQGLLNIPVRFVQTLQKLDPGLLGTISPGATALPLLPKVKQVELPQASGVAGKVGNFVGSMAGFAAIPEVEGGLAVKTMADAAIGASQDPDHPITGALTVGGLSGVTRSIPRLPFINRLSALRKTNEASRLGIQDKGILNEAAKRSDIASQAGVTGLTAGALTRQPEIQAREELLLKGDGGPASAKIRQSADSINKQIINSAQGIQKTLGGSEKTALAMGSDVQDILGVTRKDAMKKISSIYDKASSSAGSDVEVPKEGILNELDDAKGNIVDFKLTPNLEGRFNDLETKPLTVRDANDLAVSINKAIRGTSDRPTRLGYSRVLNKTYDAMDQLGDNQNLASRDLFVLARQSRRAVGDVFDQKDIVNDLVSNKGSQTSKISPEKAVDRIFGKTNNITNINKIENALKFNIDDAGNKIPNPEGEKTWDNLRTTKLGQIINNSTNNINGQPVLSYSKIIKSINQTGPEAMSKLIDNKEVFNKFDNLVKTMEFSQNKAPGTINYSNTANAISRLSKNLGTSVVRLIPGGGFMSDFVRSITEHAKDSRWVEDNLRFQDKLKFLRNDLQKKKLSTLGKILGKGSKAGLLATIANELGGQ